MSKIDRRNQARQKQNIKHQQQVRDTSLFSGPNAAPRHVAVVPLSADVDALAAIRQLNDSVDIPDDPSQRDIIRVKVDRFKSNVMYIPAKPGLVSGLDICQLADFVLLILSADQEVDEAGQVLLKSIEGQGISNVLAMVQGLDHLQPLKRRLQVSSSLRSFIRHFFPTLEKTHSLDSRQDCSNLVRSLCTSTPKGIRWRDDRSWMLIENMQSSQSEIFPTQETGGVTLTGVVRGRGLKADRLVHIPGWGEYQIDHISASPLSVPSQRKEGEMIVDGSGDLEPLDQPTGDQDDLAVVAPGDIAMRDEPIDQVTTEKKGVLLDDHHYFSDDDSHPSSVPKRLPRGTSSYQAAWYLDDVSDSGSDLVDHQDLDWDIQMDSALEPEDGISSWNERREEGMTEAGPSEYPQSEMFIDPSPEDEAEELQSYRKQRKSEADEDREFPDEIELHPNVLARERLARYRGLKSLRTSKWELEEDRAREPDDWRRLLQVADYKGSKNQAIREALARGVAPGTRVDVHLRDVPLSLLAAPPLAVFGLLRHEHKLTVANISMTINSDAPAPIKSKEELVIQCGPRRLVINPIFSSSGQTPNNVHKFDRYLHPGRNAMATFIGPLIWGAVPVLVFKSTNIGCSEQVTTAADIASSSTLQLIGTGTVAAPDQNRVVAKRAILTGHPYKIHKKLVTVRYMFFNAEDVNWFKALQLWTKRGRSGFIKESLGMHGYFKATFDGKINPQDAVGISLYKRVFPRRSKPWEEPPN